MTPPDHSRCVSQINSLVRERNRLLRERSLLRAQMRSLFKFVEQLGGSVGPNMRALAKRGRR